MKYMDHRTKAHVFEAMLILSITVGLVAGLVIVVYSSQIMSELHAFAACLEDVSCETLGR